MSSLDLDAGRDRKDHETIFDACRQGQVDVVRHLLSQSPHTIHLRDAQGATLLHAAPSRERVLFLMTQGAGVHAVGPHGATPLHRACARGHLAVVQSLVEAGADPRVLTKSCLTVSPEDYAFEHDHAHVAEYMMDIAPSLGDSVCLD